MNLNEIYQCVMFSSSYIQKFECSYEIGGELEGFIMKL